MDSGDRHDEGKRAFLAKVASVSIAAAFGGAAALTSKAEAQPKRAVAAERLKIGAKTPLKASFNILQRGVLLDKAQPEGSALEEGGLKNLADALDLHPDVASLALMKQTAKGLATDEAARSKFAQDPRGALKQLSIDVPAGLLPNQLELPNSIRTGAIQRKGWGIGSGHSNHNRWSRHTNHRRYSDYTDWW